MASAGLLPGVITCIFSGGVAVFGLYLLSLCAAQTGHRRASFHAVSQLTFPKAAVFFDAAIAIKCFGVSIRYASSFTAIEESAG
jgi:amino acid permease